MITANSRRTHRVDTEVEMFDATPVPPPAVRCAPRRRSLLQVLRRAVLGPIYRYHLRCIREEREGYQAAGMPLGPRYLAACQEQERDLRSRLAMLEVE